MKKPHLILLIALLVLHLAGIGQNSNCSSPSGAMRQPNDSIPTCFAGFGASGTGPLTQYYTFIATTPTMAIQLTPVLGTSCSFPNTGINYSGFQLYGSSDCVTLLGTSPNMNGLVVGEMYTFGLTMTPQDPGCVWIAQACPRVVEVVMPLPAVTMNMYGWEDRDEVDLAWEVGADASAVRFVVKRRCGALSAFEEVGEVAPLPGTTRYGWTDVLPPVGRVQYQVDMVGLDGERGCSEVVEVEVDGSGELVVSPVPCHDEVRLHFPAGDDRVYALDLYAVDGSVVRVMQGTGAALNAELSDVVRGLPPSVYLLRSYDGLHAKVARMVKW